MKQTLTRLARFALAIALCVALARGAAYVLMFGRERITLGETSVTFGLAVLFINIWWMYKED